ncbi:MAG: TMEM43 family protein [Phycisphaeraceae bacterium JB051]
MSTDRYTEVTTESWGSRIGNSIKGIFIGILLIIAAFPVLFLNEGRAVKRYKTLKEGGSNVIAVKAEKVDPALQDKLIHISGVAKTQDILHDDQFGVTTNAMALIREVQMYQWKESKTTKEEKQLGGSVKKVTTYDYTKVWSDRAISSNDFKVQANHQNPGRLPFEDHRELASNVFLGEYELGQNIVGAFEGATAFSVSDTSKLPKEVKQKTVAHAGGYYIGQSPQSPQIGDVKVHFKIIKPETSVSVVGKQVDNHIEKYKTDVGGDILLIEMGLVSADDMFKKAQAQNTMFTWLLRGLGFILMVIGFATVLKPLSVLADVVPFIGNLVESGTALIAILLGGMLSLITIAIGWIAFRPVLGLSILAIAGVFGFLGFLRMKAGKAKRKARIEAMDLSMPA